MEIVRQCFSKFNTWKLKNVQHHIYTIFHLGNYGNQIDGVSKPASAKKKKEGGGESEEEESELIHNSSDEEAEDDGDLMSVPSTPPMKPVITDRSEVKERGRNYAFLQKLLRCLFNKSVLWLKITHTGNFIYMQFVKITLF